MPPKDSADLVVEARWVLPIAPANVPLSRHAIAVKDGKIAAIGPTVDILSRFEAREHVVKDHHVLMPGFVNAHTHAAMTLLRGLPARGPLMPWLRETIWPAEQRWLGPDFVRDGTQLAIAEMLRAGITTFGDMYLFPEETARVASDARVRAVIGLPIAEAATPWADDATAYFAKAEQLWDEYKSNPWVCLQFAPHAPYSVSDATLQRVRRVADELDARVVMHLHETEVEVQDSLATYGMRPLRRLDELGLLRPGFVGVHMNRLDDEDLETVARTGVAVIACPQSNLRLGSGVCPLTALLSRNVCIGLGTDGSASAGALDMLAEARTAALLTQESSAEEALRLATLGSAATVGLSALIGSLEVDKFADLICIDLETLACQPNTSPAAAVLYAATRQQVSDVWIAGRATVADGRLLTFDEQKLLHLARDWAARIHGDCA
jgi:5-methylthioadenosine/S-adenosylhomocysteine deaminase